MGRRAVVTGHWLSDGEAYEEGYVGEIVGEWTSGAEWLASRDVAERVALRQQQLRAESRTPEDVADLRFHGDTLVVTSHGHVERYAPQDDGRYLIAFGWGWNAADPAEVYLVYGAPELTERFAEPLAVLRRAAVPAWAATLFECPIVRADLGDGTHLDLRPRDLASLPTGDDDAVREWLRIAAAATRARHELLAGVTLRLIEADATAGRLPEVRSWDDVAAYRDGHLYLQKAAQQTGIAAEDYVTQYGAVELIDAALANGSFTVAASDRSASVQAGPHFARRIEVISGDWLVDPATGRYAEAYVGTLVSHWNGWAEWLATRAVVERVVATQGRLSADTDLDPDALAGLRFEGDTLVVSEPGGEERYEPTADGRYRMSFGWTWEQIDPGDANVIYGDTTLTRAYRHVLDALRVRGVHAVAASVSEHPYLHVDLADGGHIEVYDPDRDELPADPTELRRWVAVVHRPDGEADFVLYESDGTPEVSDTGDLVQHVATMAETIRELEAETLNLRVAEVVMRLVRADVTAGRVPPVRSYAELRDHVDPNEYLVAAANEVGVSASDIATLNGAVTLIDAELAGRLWPPISSPGAEAAEALRRLDHLEQRPPEPPDLSL